MQKFSWLIAGLALCISSVALAAQPWELERAPASADALKTKSTFISLAPTANRGGGDICGNGAPGVGICDDGNTDPGDGCSATCFVEDDYTCTAALPPPVNESIGDGGLETGGVITNPGMAPNDFWTETSNLFGPICNGPTCVVSGANLGFEGLHWAWYGGSSAQATDSDISQEITIPNDATTLTFNYLAASVGADTDNDMVNDIPCGTNADELTISMDDGLTTTQIWSSLDETVGGTCEETTGTTPSPLGLPYDGVSIDLSTAAGGPYNDGGTYTITVRGVQTPTFPSCDDTVEPPDCTATGFTNFFADNFSIGVPTGDPATPSACTEHFYGETFDTDPPAARVGDLGGFILFDDTTVGPPPGADGWATTDAGFCGAANWAGGNTTGGTGEALCADSDNTGAGIIMNAYACTPAIDFTGTTDNFLTFKVNYQIFGDPTAEDAFEVLTGTAAPSLLSIGGYTSLFSTTENIGPFGEGPGEVQTYDISSLDGEATGHVCFRYAGDFDWYAEIDDVHIDNDQAGDTDLDGFANGADNCILVPQVSGAGSDAAGTFGDCDSDGDGFGNACDGDYDDNGFVVFADLLGFKERFGPINDIPPGDAEADHNCTGVVVNFGDLQRFGELFGTMPGPSGTAP